ncbi:MAG: hypothetical protein KatS3mg016_1196 [Fimbriimonadales bacterium]|nr:MAG: hypothetical protein KatS3mg016_1196 [Fimbriimonadales bacterium]GIV07842.1 MAG: hypothetical protein KatS3mg017_1044 [Fimbriimonadales bacterium]
MIRNMYIGLTAILLITTASSQTSPTRWRVDWLGVLPNGNYSKATDVSNQGDCVGYGDYSPSSDSGYYTRGWIWRNGTLNILHYGAITDNSCALCISPDGGLIGGAGKIQLVFPDYLVGGVPVIWGHSCTVQAFPESTAFNRVGAVYDISANGIAAVTLGTATAGPGQAYWWQVCTENYGRLPINHPCHPAQISPADVFSVSYDGAVFVGDASCASDEAFTRVNRIGFVFTHTASLLGSGITCDNLCNSSVTMSISGNNRVISGRLNQQGGVWLRTQTGWVFEIFPQPDFIPAVSNGIDYHGVTVVGSLGQRAVAWENSDAGWVKLDLTDICHRLGILSRDDRLITATAVSPNARYIVGVGLRKIRNENGQDQYRAEAFRIDRRIARILPIPIPWE